MKERVKVITGIVFLMAAVLVFHAPSAGAKTKVPKFSKRNISIQKGDRVKIAVKNASPKKARWTVNKSGKSVVKLSSLKKKSVMVKGKRAGTATVTAKITLKGKKIRTLRAKVKVGKKGKNGNITVVNKKQAAFPGTVRASLTEAGYVKLHWDSAAGAHAYVLQRRSSGEGWENLKVTAYLSFTDREVEDNSLYQYRVRANCDGMCTAFSEAVEIKTGKVGDNSITVPMPTDNPVPIPTKDPVSEPEPTKTPEPTPYEAKYSYEVEVLNQFTIYENVPVVLFIKTDNPDPNDFDNVYVSFSGGSGSCGHCYSYEDIEYLNTQEDKQSTSFRKVNGGFIYTIEFQDSGLKTVAIKELDKSGDRNVWRTVDTFQIEVHNGEKALQEHCNNIIKIVSDENYDEDGMGKWITLSDPDKMKRLEKYIRNHMHYPALGAETSLGYLPVWIIQENVGAFWETGFADCGAANEMMCVLARILGFEAQRQNTSLNGMLHIVAMVNIDGEEYKYDATPYQGGYKDWDYIL